MNNNLSDLHQDDLLARLSERVKELTALHRTARLLQDENRTTPEVMEEIVTLLPSAFQFPEYAVVRITFKDQQFCLSPWDNELCGKKANFHTRAGDRGAIEVCYVNLPDTFGNPMFIEEEVSLLHSLADMVRGYFQRKNVEAMLQTAYADLEAKFRSQMVELERSNEALENALDEHKQIRAEIETYQRQLQTMAQEMTLVEARERRIIATELHDHIGQALLAVKMRMTHFRNGGISSGLDPVVDEIVTLLDQTIQFTRSLTFEISSPILYDLGLRAAIERLLEQYGRKHDISVELLTEGVRQKLPEEYKIILFKSVKELLVNAIKHSNASKVTIMIQFLRDEISVTVTDNGCGFDPLSVKPLDDNSFGLFSIRERLRYMGGGVVVRSAIGQGTNITLTLKLKRVTEYEAKNSVS